MKNKAIISVLILAIVFPQFATAAGISAQTERIAVAIVLENEAKTPGWSRLQNIDRWVTVTVHRKGNGKVKGHILHWDEQGIVMVGENGEQLSIAKQDVSRVTTGVVSAAAGAQRGALIGALAGLGFFALIYAAAGGCDAGYQCNDTGPALALVVASGATGAFIGSAFKAESDKVLYQAGDYRKN